MCPVLNHLVLPLVLDPEAKAVFAFSSSLISTNTWENYLAQPLNKQRLFAKLKQNFVARSL